MTSVFSPEEKIRTWLEVELQALKSRAHFGEIPKNIPDLVASKARVTWDRVCEIEAETKHDVIAFLTALNENLGDESRHVHYGMTSSDVLDTGLALQCVKALDMITDDLKKLLEVCRTQALAHKNTLCVGRSHGVHGEPMVLGLKFLLWTSDIARLLENAALTRRMIAVGKCSGAMGTLVHLSAKVEEHFCAGLGLKAEPVATQVVQRDRHAQLACFLALVGAEIEKISVELRHLQRSEVLEVEEAFTKGQKGSSAMPHKKNPISAENLTGIGRMLKSYVHAALDNVALWHERDISHSSVERVFLPDAFISCDYALDRLTTLVRDLQINREQALRNLNLTRGLVYSQRALLGLVESGISREDAYKVIQDHSMRVWNHEKLNLLDSLATDPVVTKKIPTTKLKEFFEPSYFLKSVPAIYERVERVVKESLENAHG